ncbi:hypothetical protein [Sandarakinorhabdus sp. DWP1-3-1]|uniref:hypothetical protein n=1 Tax=Sandarakinorhabdus sp. DWP1-3-1 TaxID=2804627 RepID=UPI003CE9F4BA
MFLFLVQSGTATSGLDWPNTGRLPLLMVLVAFLPLFGLGGLILQQAVLATAGALLPWYAAVPAAIAIAAPATRIATRGLARVLPHDETTAVAIDTLLGRRARIVIENTRQGHPARARVEKAVGLAPSLAGAHAPTVEPAAE